MYLFLSISTSTYVFITILNIFVVHYFSLFSFAAYDLLMSSGSRWTAMSVLSPIVTEVSLWPDVAAREHEHLMRSSSHPELRYLENAFIATR